MESALQIVALNTAQFAALIALFLPGFVSLKTDRLIHPGRPMAASETIIEIIGYSLLNAGVFSWLILKVADDLKDGVPQLSLLIPVAVTVCLVGPALWPLGFRWLQSFGAKRGFLIGPHRYAWDNVFSRRRFGFVIVHLTDGQHIGGYFGENSYASVEPESGHLYLEELWVIDQEGRFLNRLPDSLGAVFRPSDYKWVEFFEDDVDEI